MEDREPDVSLDVHYGVDGVRSIEPPEDLFEDDRHPGGGDDLGEDDDD